MSIFIPLVGFFIVGSSIVEDEAWFTRTKSIFKMYSRLESISWCLAKCVHLHSIFTAFDGKHDSQIRCIIYLYAHIYLYLSTLWIIFIKNFVHALIFWKAKSKENFYAKNLQAKHSCYVPFHSLRTKSFLLLLLYQCYHYFIITVLVYLYY